MLHEACKVKPDPADATGVKPLQVGAGRIVVNECDRAKMRPSREIVEKHIIVGLNQGVLNEDGTFDSQRPMHCVDRRPGCAQRSFGGSVRVTHFTRIITKDVDVRIACPRRHVKARTRRLGAEANPAQEIPPEKVSSENIIRPEVVDYLHSFFQPGQARWSVIGMALKRSPV